MCLQIHFFMHQCCFSIFSKVISRNLINQLTLAIQLFNFKPIMLSLAPHFFSEILCIISQKFYWSGFSLIDLEISSDSFSFSVQIFFLLEIHNWRSYFMKITVAGCHKENCLKRNFEFWRDGHEVKIAMKSFLRCNILKKLKNFLVLLKAFFP